MRSRLPTLLLALLCALPVLGFLPKLFGPRTEEPLDRRPTWAQVVVVTCGELPTDLDLSGPGFAALEERSARAGLSPAGPSAAAAVLWAGHVPQPPGGNEGELIVAASPWTLAEAARRSGAATAAFLGVPLVTQAGLAGFSTVVESPELTPERMAALADEHFAAHADERVVVWLHLADAGPRGRALDDLLERLHRSLESHGHRWDALLVVTSLPAEPPSTAVPLWIELPNSLYAGRHGQGAADLTELPATLLSILRLPAPDVTRGELPLAPAPNLPTLLQGGSAK